MIENNLDIGFSCISKNYIDDIRNGKSKILMFFIYEGYSGMKNNEDFEIIEKWRLESSLPKNSIFYVCGNLLSEKIVIERNLGFEAKGVSHFEPWNKYKGNAQAVRHILLKEQTSHQIHLQILLPS